MIRGAGQQEKLGGRIAFTRTGLIFEAGPPDGTDNENSYQDISDIRVSEHKGQKALSFRRSSGIKCLIKSSQMKSTAEFDEMAAMLVERTQSKDPVGASLSR